MAVITVSREVASGGDEIAHRVCDMLGYRYFDKALMVQVAREQGIAETEVVDFSEDSYQVRGVIAALLRRSAPVATATVRVTTTRGEDAFVTQVLDEEMAAEFVAATIHGLRTHGNVVVVGRGGQAILRNQPGVLHVRMVARREDRVARLVGARGSPERRRRICSPNVTERRPSTCGASTGSTGPTRCCTTSRSTRPCSAKGQRRY